jgi:hypothetical protein
LDWQAFGIAPHLDCGFCEALVDVGEDGDEGIERCVEEHGVRLELEGIYLEESD